MVQRSDNRTSNHGGRYEAEALRSHKWKGKKLIFEVKWRNFPDEDNTWETEENLL
jgi:hypothetical protein